MGSDVSKEINDIINGFDMDSKSCVTPTNVTHCAYKDPRSPTEGIMRTPIEVRKLFENTEEMCPLRRRWKSEPELTPVKTTDLCKDPYHILWNDPRSPTLGIARTPIQIPCRELISEKIYSNENLHNSVLKKADVIVNVQDCRSPSLGICRTPIEVASYDENDTSKESIVKDSAIYLVGGKSHTAVSVPWNTPTSKKAASSSFVYADDNSIEIEGKRDTKQYEQNSVHEKENDTSLKRKLLFTPEAAKSGVKVRTPLGSRCNFQDSPSQFLKIIQVQKVDQDLENASDKNSSSFGIPNGPTNKGLPVIQWDNKDSTLIM